MQVEMFQVRNKLEIGSPVKRESGTIEKKVDCIQENTLSCVMSTYNAWKGYLQFQVFTVNYFPLKSKMVAKSGEN